MELKNIKVYTGGKGKELVSKLFKLGCAYENRGKCLIGYEKGYTFIYIDNKGIITYGNDMNNFVNKEYKEMSCKDILNLPLMYQFKPFEKVLVRDTINQLWRPDFYNMYSEDNSSSYPYKTISGAYVQCIPYEGNEDLLGTNASPGSCF